MKYHVHVVSEIKLCGIFSCASCICERFRFVYFHSFIRKVAFFKNLLTAFFKKRADVPKEIKKYKRVELAMSDHSGRKVNF